MELIIRQDDLNAIIKMAERSAVEICGFLFGRREGNRFIVEEARFVPNRLNSPTEFEMEPVEMVKAIDEAEGRGLEVVGIFHSHLNCLPRPSGKDLVGMKLWPVVWLIVDEKGNYGAYVLRDGEVVAFDVRVVPLQTKQPLNPEGCKNKAV
ncbi:M67 family metallopeptidase [Thermococcus sp.]|uniref:M67 family metallopeptidase n=1 Tax=Thermococcus sp. TaxID=35749 RepID=UPI0025E28C4D|nr:M67 family metallopeptidase [Thermococcus sp.]